MTTALWILLIVFLWVIFDFVIVVIASNKDKQDMLLDNKLLTWTIMLPLTLITMGALFVIQLMGKK